MAESLSEAVRMPTERPPGCPFEPPQDLARIRSEGPLRRLEYPDGHVGWLATSREAVRAVLAHPRFSAQTRLLHIPIPSRMGEYAGEFPPPQPGDFTNIDPPDHTRYRRLLTGQFTVHRMRQLAARVEEITTECLDDMERQGPGVDLVSAFAQPIPALVICELLGVPYEERGRFQEPAMTLTGADAAVEELGAAVMAIQGFLLELVVEKRANPGDDLLSGLTTSDLTDEELANIGMVLLGAGLDTTANMLALGTFTLLQNPDQLAALRADPSMADQAVEELLRYLSIIPWTMRTALEDVELGGQLIAKGECVTVSLEAANRDPERFGDPDVLDLRRSTSGQVAFGHGIHQCLGQQLARVEMRSGFPALFKRFPTLRLAVPPADVRMRPDALITGIARLPVTWDA